MRSATLPSASFLLRYNRQPPRCQDISYTKVRFFLFFKNASLLLRRNQPRSRRRVGCRRYRPPSTPASALEGGRRPWAMRWPPRLYKPALRPQSPIAPVSRNTGISVIPCIDLASESNRAGVPSNRPLNTMQRITASSSHTPWGHQITARASRQDHSPAKTCALSKLRCACVRAGGAHNARALALAYVGSPLYYGNFPLLFHYY